MFLTVKNRVLNVKWVTNLCVETLNHRLLPRFDNTKTGQKMIKKHQKKVTKSAKKSEEINIKNMFFKVKTVF